MEKRKPSHDLDAFKRQCGDPRGLVATGTALRGARELGLGRFDMAAAVRSMTATMFVKSMTSYTDHRAWQDVYHVPYGDEVIYLKFTADAVAEFRILSFKER